MLVGKSAARRAKARARQTRRVLVMSAPTLCVLRALSPAQSRQVARATELRREDADGQALAEASAAPRR